MKHPLYRLLRDLNAASIYFELARYRDDSVTVLMTLVGERVEVDVFEDGSMEVSRFPGSEDIAGGAELVARIVRENDDRRIRAAAAKGRRARAGAGRGRGRSA